MSTPQTYELGWLSYLINILSPTDQKVGGGSKNFGPNEFVPPTFKTVAPPLHEPLSINRSLLFSTTPATQRQRQDFSFGGLWPRGSWDRSLPAASRGEAQWRSEGQSPQKLKQFCRQYLQIMTAETIKIWKFCTIQPVLLTSPFHGGG